MSRLTEKQKLNLRDRVERDAKAAISELIADSMKYERVSDERIRDLKLIAQQRDAIASRVVNHLLKHYTIRDRKR